MPNLNNNNNVLYVGKSTSGCLHQRILEHMGGKRRTSTWCLKINAFNKILKRIGVPELIVTIEAYVLDEEKLSVLDTLDVYVSAYESLLHKKLKPKIGSSK